jgi:hypothetical protein
LGDVISEIPFFVKNHFMKYGKIHKKSRFFSISFNIVDFTKSYGIIEIKNEKGFLRDIIFFGETLSPVLKTERHRCAVPAELGGI